MLTMWWRRICSPPRRMSPGTVLNVAGGSHTSVNEVLQVFEQVAGSKLAIRHVEDVAGDVRRTGGDTAAIRSVLGWQPTVSLRDGIARQLSWAANIARR